MIVLRFIACAHTVAMLSNGEYFNAELNEGLFEGDIMLTEAQRRIIMSGGDITSYSAVEGGNWPDGIIPYVIVDSSNINKWPDLTIRPFTKKQLDLIKDAMKLFKYATCVKFVKKRKHHQLYIRIENRLTLNKNTSKLEEGGCFVEGAGRDPNKMNGQSVNLGTGCFQNPDGTYFIGT